MKRLCLLLLVLLSPQALAVNLTLIADEDLTGLPATVIADRVETYIVREGNLLSLPHETGDLKVLVSAQRIYAGHHAITSPVGELVMAPVAKISGRVIDEKENLLQHAPLKVLCSPPARTVPNETDELGFFSIEEVRFGTCEISAIAAGRAGTARIDVNESKHYIVTVQVPVEAGERSLAPLALIALLVAIGASYAILAKKGAKPAARKGLQFTRRQEDLLATLSERERLIVTDLFYSGKLTQSQLRHKSKLPKSTLHRTLRMLEQKSIVLQTEEAGVKKVALTEFFWNGRSGKD